MYLCTLNKNTPVLIFLDDDFATKPGPSKPPKKSEVKDREVLKEVDPKDFFGLAAKKVKPNGKIRILSKFKTTRQSKLLLETMGTNK